MKTINLNKLLPVLNELLADNPDMSEFSMRREGDSVAVSVNADGECKRYMFGSEYIMEVSE